MGALNGYMTKNPAELKYRKIISDWSECEARRP